MRRVPGRRIFLALALIVGAGSALAQPARSDKADDDREPPLHVVVEADGEELPVRVGEPATVRIGGKDVDLRLSLRPYRRFDKRGLSFLYPRTMTWEVGHIDNPFILTQWDLQGAAAGITIIAYPLNQGTAKQLVEKVALSAAHLYGQDKIVSTERTTYELGGRQLPAATLKIQVTDGLPPTRLFIAGFDTKTNVFALTLQDNKPLGADQPSREYAEVEALLQRSFRFPRATTTDTPTGAGDERDAPLDADADAATVVGPVEAPAPPPQRRQFLLAVLVGCASCALMIAGARMTAAGAPPATLSTFGAPHGTVRWLIALILSGVTLARLLTGRFSPDNPARDVALWLAALVALGALRGPGAYREPGDDEDPLPPAPPFGPLGMPPFVAPLLLGLATFAGALVALGRIGMRLDDPTLPLLMMLTAYWAGRAEAGAWARFGGIGRHRWLIDYQQALPVLSLVILAGAGLVYDPAISVGPLPWRAIEWVALMAPAYYAGAR